jgi:hypothetical protein
MAGSKTAQRFRVGNPRGIPAEFPVIELADGRAFSEGDEVTSDDLSPKVVKAWLASGILEAVSGKA